jgi:hypothetical protein
MPWYEFENMVYGVPDEPPRWQHNALYRRYAAWRSRRNLRNYVDLGYITDEDWGEAPEAKRLYLDSIVESRPLTLTVTLPRSDEPIPFRVGSPLAPPVTSYKVPPDGVIPGIYVDDEVAIEWHATGVPERTTRVEPEITGANGESAVNADESYRLRKSSPDGWPARPPDVSGRVLWVPDLDNTPVETIIGPMYAWQLNMLEQHGITLPPGWIGPESDLEPDVGAPPRASDLEHDGGPTSPILLDPNARGTLRILSSEPAKFIFIGDPHAEMFLDELAGEDDRG